jgi:hypothetical protein
MSRNRFIVCCVLDLFTLGIGFRALRTHFELERQKIALKELEITAEIASLSGGASGDSVPQTPGTAD